eukprot:3329921-Rhodomonas_salina.4
MSKDIQCIPHPNTVTKKDGGDYGESIAELYCRWSKSVGTRSSMTTASLKPLIALCFVATGFHFSLLQLQNLAFSESSHPMFLQFCSALAQLLRHGADRRAYLL